MWVAADGVLWAGMPGPGLMRTKDRGGDWTRQREFALLNAPGGGYGADGAGSLVYALSVAPGGVDSGVETTSGTKPTTIIAPSRVQRRRTRFLGLDSSGSADMAGL